MRERPGHLHENDNWSQYRNAFIILRSINEAESDAYMTEESVYHELFFCTIIRRA